MTLAPPASTRARISVSSSFFVFAAVMGSWAARVPAIKQPLGLSNAQLGIALLALAAGFVAGTRVAPALIDRRGSAIVVRLAIYGLCVSLIGPALARGLVTLSAALGVMGTLGGVSDVGINAQGVVVERRQGRPLMSGFHALWSFGAMVAGGIAAAAAAADVSPLAHFTVAALVLLAASASSLRWLAKPVAEQPQPDLIEHRAESAPLIAVAVLGLISFSSFIGEGSAADWSAVYLREVLGATEGVAAFGFAAFAGAMALCRLRADAVVARLGPATVARAGLLLGAAGLALALLVGDAAIAIGGFALLGVGLAPVIPLAFSAAGNTGPRSSSRVLGRVLMMGYLGAIVGPVAIGFLAEHIGLRAALVVPVALALVAAVVAGRVAVAGGPERMEP